MNTIPNPQIWSEKSLTPYFYFSGIAFASHERGKDNNHQLGSLCTMQQAKGKERGRRKERKKVISR